MAVGDYNDTNSDFEAYGSDFEAYGSDFEAHDTNRTSCENSTNHATSDVEFVDNGVKYSVARSLDSNATVNEFEEITDEEICAMHEVIAAQKPKSLKICIPAPQK
ncbi:hypothetical protein PAXRUDRAFT_836586 [Paxillus rubicundulus Ve08.2h10]|uniref:Unplaced genomic scaffold scaffold_6817, whole genome shotgun sequence n=1 Tax=Paxillus rubicundulus Ve08.2h10 TaxID=930991 RepID=A0A0D0D4P5_9AGAM|nr:hypothetical protein PAXRUDRAFT_836586 [Paxillus rubicundulus Ve08.2h10]